MSKYILRTKYGKDIPVKYHRWFYADLMGIRYRYCPICTTLQRERLYLDEGSDWNIVAVGREERMESFLRHRLIGSYGQDNPFVGRRNMRILEKANKKENTDA